MCFETLAIACQRDVHEILVISQIFECRCDAALVIIPSQAKVLRIYHRYAYSPRTESARGTSNKCYEASECNYSMSSALILKAAIIFFSDTKPRKV